MLLDVSPFCRAIPVRWDRAANFLSLVPCPKSNQVTLYARSSLRGILSLPFRWKVGLFRSSLPLLPRGGRMVCGVRLRNPASSPRVNRGPTPGIAWGEGLARRCGDAQGPGTPSAQDSYLAEKKGWV